MLLSSSAPSAANRGARRYAASYGPLQDQSTHFAWIFVLVTRATSACWRSWRPHIVMASPIS